MKVERVSRGSVEVNPRRHRAAARMAVVVLVVTAAACGSSKSAAPASTAGASPTTGASASPTTGASTSPTTGASTSAAATGEKLVIAGLQGEVAEGGPDFMAGMKVAADEINKAGGVDGRLIDLQIIKTGGTPEGAASAYKQAGDNSKVIGAFLGASGALAIRAQSDVVQLPVITASGNDKIDIPITKYVFSNSAGKEYATSSLVYAVKTFGAKRVASINYGTDFSSQIPDALKGRCATLGCQVVDTESAAADASVDALVPQLTKMKGANPDVYYLEGLNPNVYAAAKQLGITKPIIAEQWLAVPGLRDACGANCEGVVFGIHKCNVPDLLVADDPLKKICDTYRADFVAAGQAWAGFSIYGRDAVYTYAAAADKLIKAGKSITRDNIVTTMETFNGELLTTHGAIHTSATNHRLTGTWTEAYIDVAVKVVGGKATWVLAPKADPKGSTP